MLSTENAVNAEEMRNYIDGFLKEYEYDLLSSECLLSTYDQITANPEAFGLMEQILRLYSDDYLCEFDGIFAISGKRKVFTPANQHLSIP